MRHPAASLIRCKVATPNHNKVADDNTSTTNCCNVMFHYSTISKSDVRGMQVNQHAYVLETYAVWFGMFGR